MLETDYCLLHSLIPFLVTITVESESRAITNTVEFVSINISWDSKLF